jgi:hypothetical protein
LLAWNERLRVIDGKTEFDIGAIIVIKRARI